MFGLTCPDMASSAVLFAGVGLLSALPIKLFFFGQDDPPHIRPWAVRREVTARLAAEYSRRDKY